jgi:hypothetical protein
MKWAIKRRKNVLCLSHELEGGGGICCIHKWDVHWKVVNASFEEVLNMDEDL